MWVAISIGIWIVIVVVVAVVGVFCLGAMPTEVLTKEERRMWHIIGIVCGVLLLAVIMVCVWFFNAKYNGH